MEKKGLSNRIFIGLVATLLLVPMSKINLDDRLIEENRMLKPFPSVCIDGKLNSNIFKDFEVWFSDRFNQRDRLIIYAHRLDSRINREVSTERAFLGKEGWIFTKERNSIGNFQNTTYFTEHELNLINENVGRRRDWLAKQGIKFYMFIAPDKNQIYGEYYSDKIKKIGSQNQIDQVYQCLKDRTQIKIIYPIKNLMDEKHKGMLYYKDDTHWTPYGAYFGYKALINLVKGDYPELEIVPENNLVLDSKTVTHNDLLRMLKLGSAEYEKINWLVV